MYGINCDHLMFQFLMVLLGKQFNYTPRDFEIAKTVTGIAERTVDPSITFFPISMCIFLQLAHFLFVFMLTFNIH